jgi:pimeloyl-ACP methyl ester carboxylesterase
MTKLGERVVTSADGLKLTAAKWGAPQGLPVFSLHGTPGSRLGRDPDEVLYDRLDMHLVTYDRPGYGGSDRQRARRVVDAVADVVSIADALGFDRIGVAAGYLAIAGAWEDHVLWQRISPAMEPPSPQ